MTNDLTVTKSTFPLKVSPNELNFAPPLNRTITNLLKLHNTGQELISYKVKTTAPKRYCVRPNTGIINPNEQVQVQVVLNFSKDPPLTLKSTDKFQIQSVIVKVPPGQKVDATSLKNVWSSTPKDHIMKQKLRCYFSSKNSTSENNHIDNNNTTNHTSQLDSVQSKDTQGHLEYSEDQKEYGDALDSSDEKKETTPTTVTTTTISSSSPSLSSSATITNHVQNTTDNMTSQSSSTSNVAVGTSNNSQTTTNRELQKRDSLKGPLKHQNSIELTHLKLNSSGKIKQENIQQQQQSTVELEKHKSEIVNYKSEIEKYKKEIDGLKKTKKYFNNTNSRSKFYFINNNRFSFFWT